MTAAVCSHCRCVFYTCQAWVNQLRRAVFCCLHGGLQEHRQHSQGNEMPDAIQCKVCMRKAYLARRNGTKRAGTKGACKGRSTSLQEIAPMRSWRMLLPALH